jgi:hypothetical protein
VFKRFSIDLAPPLPDRSAAYLVDLCDPCTKILICTISICRCGKILKIRAYSTKKMRLISGILFLLSAAVTYLSRKKEQIFTAVYSLEEVMISRVALVPFTTAGREYLTSVPVIVEVNAGEAWEK